MAIVNELVNVFSFKGSTKPLFDFNVGLSDAIGLMSAAASAMQALDVAVTTFVQVTLSSLDPMIQLSRRTKVAVETIQELGYAASVSGSNIQAVESTIDSLSQRIGEAAIRGSSDFERLGITVRTASGYIKSADTILFEVQSRFKQLGLSIQEQQSFASALGIDTSLLQLLNKSSKEISMLRQRAQELGTITQEQAETTVKYNDAITTLKFGLSGLQNQIAVGLAPELTTLTEGFTELLIENKDFIVNGVTAAVNAIDLLSDAFIRLFPFLAAAGALFLASEIAALGFSTVLGAIFSPAVLIIAAIAGILLILDDLIVAFQGGKSVIADFFDSFFGEGATQAFLQLLVDGFYQAIEQIKNFFLGLIDFIKNIFTGNFLGAIGNITSGIQGLYDFITLKGTDDTAKLNGPGSGVNQVTSNTSNNITNSVTQSNEIRVVSDDPKTAAQVISDTLQKQLADAKTQFDKGGR